MDATLQDLATVTDEGRYRLLVDAITDYAIYMLDASGAVASWNAGAQRFKGYKAREIIGQHFSRFYTEEDRAAGLPARALKTAAREGRVEMEGWRVRKDGTRFWAHVIIDAVRAEDGRTIGFAKVTRDLTERRASDLALLQSQEQFKLLVNGVTDYAIYMLDRQGLVSNWNAGAQRIKGYAADEIVGQHFSRFYTPEDREAGLPEQSLATAVREGRFEKEGWRVRKDGTRFWASVVIDAIRDDRGEVISFAKVTRDVTERRAAQEALDRAREALFQSQKLEAIGQLTGGIAHDFNNLLMAIMGSLEIARKRLAPDPRITPLLDNAMMGAERGAALTQRMLAFARRQEVNRVAVDLPQLVNGMMGLLEHALGPTVPVITQFSGKLPHVETDPNQLESALLNLAVNARDAMPDGGTIVISVRAVTLAEGNINNLPAGPYVQLAVADTGEGMDEATLAKAAEPFFTTKGVGKGTGLGLSMAHGLAEQSGGRLTIQSKLGVGTTVEVWLPVAQPDASTAAATPAAPVSQPSRRLVVLAVDDDPLVLLNTAAMLDELGHQVLEAASAKKALAVLGSAEGPVDLVITDHAMPQMTGLQLAEAIRAGWPDLPVLLATGYAELPADTDPGLPRLAKPFLEADLKRAIEEMIDRPVPPAV